MPVTEIEPADVAARRAAGERFTLVDVREPWEVDLCRVDWAVQIPMGEIPGRCGEIDRSAPVVVMCHHGGRSLRVAHFLAQQGFDRVANLTGGIDAWREQIEPSMRPY